MLRYSIRRLLQFIPTIIGASFLVFILLNVLPGNAALMMGGGKDTLPPDVIEKLEKKWGLDQPILIRYTKYMFGLLKGDMGVSFLQGEKIETIIGQRIIPSLRLAITALLIACFLGIPLGFFSALRQGSWIDTLTMMGAVSGVSLPQFWSGLLLMLLFSVTFKLLPTFGYGNGAWKHLVLPGLTLGIGYMALLARTTRAVVVEILNEEYIRTAKSKGLSPLWINRKHVMRSTLVLLLTSIGMQFGSLIGETVVVETVFSWPGIGSLMIDSIFLRDTPITMGCIMVVVLVFMTINLLVDILYCIVDPRIRFD